jgi:hypothetical protein
MGPGSPQNGDTSSNGREPFFHWYARKPVAWVGTGVAVVGLGLGIGFTGAFASADSAASGHADQISAHWNADPRKATHGSPCGPQDDSSKDIPQYATACAALRKDYSDRRTDIALAATGWALFGVGAIGTGIYIYKDWASRKEQLAETKPSIAAIPVVSPAQQGLAVVGTF